MNITQIHAQIDQAVRQGGGTPAMASYLKHIMNAESSGKVCARNPNSSAKGLFQFIDSTWQACGGGDVWDVATQCRNAVTLAHQNERMLRSVIRDRELTAGDYYLAHFAGPAGAKAVLEASADTHVRDIPIMRAACKSNPHIRNFTAGQLRAWAAGKMGEEISLSGGGDLSAEEESRRRFLRENTPLAEGQIDSMDVMGQLFMALFMGIMSKALEQQPAAEKAPVTIAANEPLPSPTPTPASTRPAASRSSAPIPA